MTIADAPTPRRTRRPRWLDVRVIFGVLLLVASVVVGAKVVGASSRTSPVWAAAHDLAAGTVLERADLVEVDVNLGDAGAAYVDAASAPGGQVLNRAVTAGELLPVAALGPVGDSRVVSVSVSPERMPPGVAHGSVIDLYLISGGEGSSTQTVTTRLLRAGITVQRVTEPASGGLSAATSNRYQVALLLAPNAADELVRALPSGQPLVVLHTGDPTARAAHLPGGGSGDGAAAPGRDDPAGGDRAGDTNRGVAPASSTLSSPSSSSSSSPSPSPAPSSSPSDAATSAVTGAAATTRAGG